MSLERESIRRTLKNLKRNVVTDVDYWLKTAKQGLEYVSKQIKEGKSEEPLVTVISHYAETGNMMLRSLKDYVDALESYISELDQTFDELLQEAEKQAKEEAEKQPKIPPTIYLI